jgi:hypothetical protein
VHLLRGVGEWGRGGERRRMEGDGDGEMEEDQDPTATNRSRVEPTINPSYGSP